MWRSLSLSVVSGGTERRSSGDFLRRRGILCVCAASGPESHKRVTGLSRKFYAVSKKESRKENL